MSSVVLMPSTDQTPVLASDEQAAITLQPLHRARIHIGTMDLKIALMLSPMLRRSSRGISQTFVRSLTCGSKTRLHESGSESKSDRLEAV
jgi:hypothetical protein